MNIYLSLQQEKQAYTSEQFTAIIAGYAQIPILEKILVKGKLEHYNLTVRPNYFKDQLKRLSRAGKNVYAKTMNTLKN